MIIDHLSLIDVEKEFHNYRYIMIVQPEESYVDYETEKGLLFEIKTRQKNSSKKIFDQSSNVEDMLSQLKT